MTSWGYTLSSEEFGPLELVDLARRAEDAGFDFLTVSDHFHPWVEAQGHSPFVWATLGGVALNTQRIPIGTGVTCPLVRVHLLIVAQAAATAAAMLPGRFFLGLGTGEALNEHITGQRWPIIEERRERLTEAMEIMRQLWSGETVDYAGEFYQVENARIFTRPPDRIPIVVAAAGAEAAQLAAADGDGMWTTHPDPDVMNAYRSAGGTGPCYGQVACCWAPTEQEGRVTALRQWPNAAVSGQLSQDLPTWTHFQQAAKLARPEDIGEAVACGPDVQAVVEQVRAFAELGVDRVHFHQIGPDQEGFMRFWSNELRPALQDVRAGAARGASGSDGRS